MHRYPSILYLENDCNDNNRSEKGVLVQPPENVPIVKDGSGVKLVEDLAKHERVEQDAAPPGTSSRKRGGCGVRDILKLTEASVSCHDKVVAVY